jgi:P-type Ca2+ transporter type 2C
MRKEVGLTEVEAKKRLIQYGVNEINDASELSPIKILLRQVRSNFVIYLLFFAMILSFFVGKYLTAYVILAVIVIMVSTGFFQEYKAEKAIIALKNMIMAYSVVIREGKEKEIPSSNIVPGDIIILRSGEKIPADCILLEERDLLINESILTGESKEVKKIVVKNENEYNDENLLFMGSFIINGKCLAKVVHTGMNSRFGKIASMISSAEKELPLQKKVNKIVKYMAIGGITVSLATGLMILFNSPVVDNEAVIAAMIIVIAVSVASFPEGFPVVLITALAKGAFRMAKKNAIVNRMSIIETLGETTVICSDKTGTITKGEMTVKKVMADNKIFEVSGVGYEGLGEFFQNKLKIDVKKEKSLSLLLKGAVVCNDSNISRLGEDNIYEINGTPTEAALLVMSAKAGFHKEDIESDREEEIPFSSERKMMSVITKEGKEFVVYSKGALEILLSKCKYIQRDSGVFTLHEREKSNIIKSNEELTSKAFRTLALAYKKTKKFNKDEIENGLIFLGFVAMEDPPREGVMEAISTCRKAGISVKMITGDNKETAVAISKQIGIYGDVLEGQNLDKMTDQELFNIVKNIAVLQESDQNIS